MRVLNFFLNRYGYGEFLRGAERRFFEVSKHLRKLGVELFALEYESFHSEKWGADSYTPIRIKQRFPNSKVSSMLRIVMLGLLYSLKHRIDVIYVSCRFAYGSGLMEGLIAPYLTSCLCGKPLVIVFHHLLQRDFAERSALALKAYQRATCLAVSEATADDVRKHLRIGRVRVVGNGIRAELFRGDAHEVKRYGGVFVGTITEQKGIFFLLEAWKIVTEKSPNAQLLLIGGIQKEIEAKFYQTVHDLRLERNVTRAGFVSDSEMVNLLKSSEIYVLPSLFEGFGLSVAEAMAAGLPCILSDIPALREVYSAAAIFVPPSDAKSLAEAILVLMRDSVKCQELRRNGYELVSQFSWEEVANREYEVLRSLTSS